MPDVCSCARLHPNTKSDIFYSTTKLLLSQRQHLVSRTCTMQGECDPSFGEDFRYSVLSEELVVGEIYVRVYNEQPTFVLEVRWTLHLEAHYYVIMM